VNLLLAGQTYTPTACYEGGDTLHLSVTSSDGSDAYPTVATAATAITVTENSEALIAGGPGPTLNWSDPDNWSGGFVPTLSTHTKIDAASCYAVIVADTQDAHAASLAIPHGAASMDIAAGANLQLAGDLDVSGSGKFENGGTLQETANATFVGPITNDGTIVADSNVHLDVTGPITGIGKFWIDSGTTLEFDFGGNVAPDTTSCQTICFEQGAGRLIIDDCGKFAGLITGTDIGGHLTSTDVIDLAQLPYVEGSMSASVAYNSATNISTITFSDGISSNNVTLHFSGSYTDSAWSFASAHGGGTEIVDPPINSGTVGSGPAGQIGAASDAVESGTPAHDAWQDFEPSSMAQVVFGRTVGTLGDSFHFRDETSGSNGSGITGLASLDDIPALMSHQDGAAGRQGLLATLEEAQTVEAPPGEHPENHFNIIPHHAPSALATHVPFDLMV
jgi:hypothetical protein